MAERPPATARCAGAGALLVAVVLGVAAPAGAAGGDPAALEGRVVNGTDDDRPTADVDLTLHVFQGEAEVATMSTRTDGEGRYEFTGLDVGAERTFSLSTEYETVTYDTPAFALEAGERRDLDLPIYEAGDSDADLRITEWQVWIDREDGRVAVQQDVTVENRGTTTFAGDEDVGEGKKAVLRLPLPPGAGGFQYLGLFMECCAVVRGTTFIHTMAIRPGTASGTVRVNTDGLDELVLDVPLPAKSLRVFVPTDVEFSGRGMQSAGTIEDMGVQYRVFTARNLARGDDLTLGVSGLGAAGSSPSRWLLAAAVSAVVAAGGFAVVRFRSRKPAARAPRADARRGAAGPDDERVAGDAPGDGRRALLVDEIAALDLAFERGALEEATYRRVREARMAELVALHGANETEPSVG